MKVFFQYKIHEYAETDEVIDSIIDQLSTVNMTTEESVELYEKMRAQGNPFYEITLDCTLDTHTGTITVEDFRL